METDNFLKNLTPEQSSLNSRIFNLIVARVFKRVYLSLDENAKEIAEKALFSSDEKEKNDFVKKYIPNFEKLFKEEAKKIEAEIKLEIEKQA